MGIMKATLWTVGAMAAVGLIVGRTRNRDRAKQATLDEVAPWE